MASAAVVLSFSASPERVSGGAAERRRRQYKSEWRNR